MLKPGIFRDTANLGELLVMNLPLSMNLFKFSGFHNLFGAMFTNLYQFVWFVGIGPS